MKTRFAFACLVALVASLPLAQAQTPVSTQPNAAPAKAAKTADQRAASYQGPKVTKDTKALGEKMVQKSKPTDTHMPLPIRVK